MNNISLLSKHFFNALKIFHLFDFRLCEKAVLSVSHRFPAAFVRFLFHSLYILGMRLACFLIAQMLAN